MSGKYTFALHTLGCKVNQYEGDEIARRLARMGLRRVDFEDIADVYVINGCTVTGAADHKARQLIRRASRRNPSAVIAVTGCYAEASASDAERLLDGSAIIVGNSEKRFLPNRIADELGISGEEQVGEAISENHRDPSSAEGALGSDRHARPFVKVQDGCNSFCSYCIVPHVRGRLSSKPLEEVVSEVASLAAEGVSEVVLTGIHLGHYGLDLKPRRCLDDLLLALSEIGGPRIRLSSIEVREVTPRIIELMATAGALCRHLHIPLQSGSDRVLKMMNRRYAAEEFVRTCEMIRQAVPDVAITTDAMVGFPGETEEDFRQTLQVIEEVGFSKVHAFRFSPRPGTPASVMRGQIEASVKEERLLRLISLADEMSSKYAARFIGKELDVVAEEEKAGEWFGTSDNYLRVKFCGPPGIGGGRVKVEAVGSSGAMVYGKLMDEG